MNPAQSRRERHERYRASGEALTVNRHGNPIGIIQWDGSQWCAIGTDSIACGRWASAVGAELAVVAHAKDREANELSTPVEDLAHWAKGKMSSDEIYDEPSEFGELTDYADMED